MLTLLFKKKKGGGVVQFIFLAEQKEGRNCVFHIPIELMGTSHGFHLLQNCVSWPLLLISLLD